MATKKPESSKIAVQKVPVTQGVDAEVAFDAAQSSSDKQWMEETAQVWAERQQTEKRAETQKGEGQAVVHLADATGVVGEKTGASLVVADASDSNNRKAAVKEQKDDDKGGYIWGGLGLLGLIGVAAAAGGGGGGGGGSAPLRLDGLVIDDPVANAVTFRDVYGDGYLHVIEAADGQYIIDPAQAVVVTDDQGQFSHLSGTERIISAGINNLPIKVIDYTWAGDATDTQAALNAAFDADEGDFAIASEGDLLYSSLAKFDTDVALNDGSFAHIVGETQIFDSLVVSSGIDLSVNGANVTLVTGVTALVDAYLNRYEGDFDPTSESDVKLATAQVAALFGYSLDENSSDEDYMSFLLGGWDVRGVDSPNNLNQEIYSIINSVMLGAKDVSDNYDLSTEDGVANYIAAFDAALNAILSVQETRVGGDLATFANDLDLATAIMEQAFDIINIDGELIDPDNREVFVQMALVHANAGGGAADIYKFDEGDLVNMVADGVQLYDDEVEVAGDITVISGGNNASEDIELDFTNGSYDAPVELMGSNINITSLGDYSSADVYIWAANAPASEMANGTLTYDPDSDSVTSIGDISLRATAYSADAFLAIETSGEDDHLKIAGDILLSSTGVSSDVSLDLYTDWGAPQSHVSEIDLAFALHNVISDYSDDNNPVLVYRLAVDDVILSATVNQNTLNNDNIDAVVADIINQWKLDPDYASLDENTLEYWGSFARLTFDGVDGHEVNANQYISSIKSSVIVNSTEPLPWTQSGTVEFEGTNITVEALEESSDAQVGVWGGSGQINDISVTADSNDSYADVELNYDGSISGAIAVSTGSDGYQADAYLSIDTEAGSIVFDGATIEAIADGYESTAEIEIGRNQMSWDTTHVNGDIDGVLVQAIGDNTSADVSIAGDITYHNSIVVEASGNDYSSADLVIESMYGQAEDENDPLATSRVTYDDIEIEVNSFGDNTSADLIAVNTNAVGSISSISVIADSERVYDGDNEGDNAIANAEIAINGDVGNITVQALNYGDEAYLELDNTDYGYAEEQFWSLGSLDSNSGFSSLENGDVITLQVGDVILSSTVTAENANNDQAILNQMIADFEADPDFSGLNIVISNAAVDDSTDSGYEGLNVRWLETGDQQELVLTVDGDVVEPYSYDGDERTGGLNFTNSTIRVEATDEDTVASADLWNAIGEVDLLESISTGDSSMAVIDLNLNGTLGDVNVEAAGDGSEANIMVYADSEALVYNDSVITLSGTGMNADVDYSQDGYATGTIESITVTASNEDADVGGYINGDITINTSINVSAIDVDNISSDADAEFDFGNLDNHSDGSNAESNVGSTFNMDGVDITVVARGNDTNADLVLNASTDDSVEIVGHIDSLTAQAGLYAPDIDESDVDPNYVADADARVYLEGMNAIVDTIVAESDHNSETTLELYGNVASDGDMTIEVNADNTAYTSVSIDTVVGDIDDITITAEEDAEAELELYVEGKINIMSVSSTTDGLAQADIEVYGAGNFVDTLTINTKGTENSNNYYTATTEVWIDQEAHGGDVVVNNSVGDFYADTLLSYVGEYQADTITLGANGHDGTLDTFNLEIQMDDIDAFDTWHQNLLVSNMTSITGINGDYTGEDAYYNSANNYINFASIDDDSYIYDTSSEGYTPDDYGISHYSDGWLGWTTNGSSYADSKNIDDGYYSSMNHFFDAAQYGIADQYAFVDLSKFYAGDWGNEETYAALTISYYNENGSLSTIYLNATWIDTDLAGNLAGDVASAITKFNADNEWDGNSDYTDTAGAWSSGNIQLFDAGDNMLGIRIGEGSFEEIQFETSSSYDASDYYTTDWIAYNNGDFDDIDISIEDGGGYFFGMVLDSDTVTYRGVLAMDEDGTGVTKLIEFADITTTNAGSGDGYDQFNANYIAIAYQEDVTTYGLANELSAWMNPEVI